MPRLTYPGGFFTGVKIEFFKTVRQEGIRPCSPHRAMDASHAKSHHHLIRIGRTGKNIRFSPIGLRMPAKNIRLPPIFLFLLTRCRCIPPV
jgi:hypothetical protein